MQSSAKGGRAGDSDERKNLQRAERRLEEARARLQATRSWMRRLERERTLYKAAISPLASALDHELPSAVALLRKMSENLEAYTDLGAPDIARLFKDAGEGEAEASTRRSGTETRDPAPEESEEERQA